jgi:hypothetical protein
MKQYNQDDINKIIRIEDDKNSVIKKPENLEIPQIEVPQKKELSSEELTDALLFTQDILERAMIPFIVLGETASAILSADIPTLYGQVIHLGVMERHLTLSTLQTVKDLLTNYHIEYYIDDNIISFGYKNVPIEIDIIHGDYAFLNNPDSRFFNLTEFRVPNPFDEYLKWGDQII